MLHSLIVAIVALGVCLVGLVLATKPQERIEKFDSVHSSPYVSVVAFHLQPLVTETTTTNHHALLPYTTSNVRKMYALFFPHYSQFHRSNPNSADSHRVLKCTREHTGRPITNTSGKVQRSD